MYLLGHIGITLSVIYLITWRFMKEKKLDYRIVIALSMLPDFIDKPLGHVILEGSLDNGRIVAHTPILSFAFTVMIHRWDRINWQIYSLPVWLHLLLDRILESPSLLFWPMLGWQFEARDYGFESLIDQLLNNPYNIIGEIIGGVIIVIMIIRFNLMQKERFLRFIRTGNCC